MSDNNYKQLPSSSGRQRKAGTRRETRLGQKTRGQPPERPKSTGPRTEEGKADAAANAYQHGFFYKNLFLTPEQVAKDKEKVCGTNQNKGLADRISDWPDEDDFPY
jgi:hypothetical protein